MEYATVLTFCGEEWKPHTKRVDKHIQHNTNRALQYLLVEHNYFSLGRPLSPELSTLFPIPEYMLCDVYQRSNGFFIFEDSFNDEGRLCSYNTWFRLLVKISAQGRGLDYVWHEMTFLSRWKPDGCSMLCIGTPMSFQNLLQRALSRTWSKMASCDPYSLHVPIIETFLSFQDLSVWCVRDSVRAVEKNRLHPTLGGQNFLLMHEAARHAIHSFEILSVSVDTLQALQQEMIDLSSKRMQTNRESADASLRIRVRTGSQIRILRNLLLRAQSNKERLQNEIALAYNLVAQRDSQVIKDIGQAGRTDSRAMRSIAVVTMAFLPPTFIAAIFSMSFFNYGSVGNNNVTSWSVSSEFWIYWAFAIPLTLLTMAIWFWREKWPGTGN